jgi:hypothetical protein
MMIDDQNLFVQTLLMYNHDFPQDLLCVHDQDLSKMDLLKMND